MNGLGLDLRLTIRGLLRTPALLVVCLATIAVGIGINTAAFSVVNAVLLRALPYESPERLVSLWPEKRWSQQMLTDVQARVGTSYEAVSTYRSEMFLLLGGSAPEPVAVATVTPTLFSVLRAKPLLGRTLSAGDATRAEGSVVVISHGLWQRAFGGDPGIIGKAIPLAGGGASTRTVVGVMPEEFEAFPANASAWVSTLAQGQPGAFNGYGMGTIARLKGDVSAAAASAQLRGIIPDIQGAHPSQFRPVRYSPQDVIPQLEMMTRGVRTKLLLLFGAVFFILLIACTNVANLLMVRAFGRQRELAVQMAIGSSQSRVVRLVLLEGIFLGLGGGALGTASAVAFLPLIRSLTSGYLPRAATVSMDWKVLVFALIGSIGAGLAFAAIPALRAALTSPADIMRATAGRGQSQGRGAARLNNMFVVAEVALSLMLMVSSGLMLKSLWRLSNVEVGFDPANVLTMQLMLPPGAYDSAAARGALLRNLSTRIGALPGVQNVASIDILPLSGGTTGFPYRVAGEAESPGSSQVVSARVVTPSYFETMRIPRLAGRGFVEQDGVPGDSGAVVSIIANEAFASLHWGKGVAVGRRIVVVNAGGVAGQTMEIVGVVRNVKQSALAAPPDPEVYFAATQGWGGGFLVIRGRSAVPSSQEVKNAVSAIDKNIGVRTVRPMTDVVRAGANDARFFARLLSVFAGAAVFLGVVGVYGVIAHAVSRRTREFGVRLAFGATALDLRRSVVSSAMRPVVVGIVCGVGGSLLLTRLLAGSLFGVSASDPLVMTLAIVLLSIAAGGASIVPANRAARLDPVEAMRQD